MIELVLGKIMSDYERLYVPYHTVALVGTGLIGSLL